jgi:6-phosphogluconate dehydrogenase
VFNRSRSKTDELVAEHPEAEFVPAFSYEEFAARCRSRAPRSSWSKPVRRMR